MGRQRGGRVEQIFIVAPAHDTGLREGNLRRREPEVEVARPFKEILKEWRTMMSQVSTLVDLAYKQGADRALGLEEMEVSIGFSATGKVVFLAEATAEASVTLVFRLDQVECDAGCFGGLPGGITSERSTVVSTSGTPPLATERAPSTAHPTRPVPRESPVPPAPHP